MGYTINATLKERLDRAVWYIERVEKPIYLKISMEVDLEGLTGLEVLSVIKKNLKGCLYSDGSNSCFYIYDRPMTLSEKTAQNNTNKRGLTYTINLIKKQIDQNSVYMLQFNNYLSANLASKLKGYFL